MKGVMEESSDSDAFQLALAAGIVKGLSKMKLEAGLRVEALKETHLQKKEAAFRAFVVSCNVFLTQALSEEERPADTRRKKLDLMQKEAAESLSKEAWAREAKAYNDLCMELLDAESRLEEMQRVKACADRRKRAARDRERRKGSKIGRNGGEIETHTLTGE